MELQSPRQTAPLNDTMNAPEKLVATANSTSRVLNLDLQHAVDVPSETQYS